MRRLARVLSAVVMMLPGGDAGLVAGEGLKDHQEGAAAAPVAALLVSVSDFDQLGIQGQYYLGRGRISAFAGISYWRPEQGDGAHPFDAMTVFTGGGRVFTSGSTNRGFLELAWGPMLAGAWFNQGVRVSQSMIYGPSLVLGYQRIAKSGLTLLAGGGPGYCRYHDGAHWSFEIRLGLGYTWRRAHQRQ